MASSMTRHARTTPVAIAIAVFALVTYLLVTSDNIPHVSPTFWRKVVPADLTANAILALSDAQLASLSAANPSLANASPLRQRLSLLSPPPATPHPYLGVASKIIVIGLARRTDRRAHMERLRHAMGLEFDWFDATDAADPRVAEILERVRLVRELSRKGVEDVVPDLNFQWSEEVQSMLAHGVPDQPVGIEQADVWTAYDDPRYRQLPPLPPVPTPDTRKPLTHMGGYNLTMPTPISLAAVSCWYSHYQVMRAIADGPDDTVIVLEDDVDMEFDLEKRLAGMWPALPKDWDIVMLGHCQSHEWSQPPLKGTPALHRSTHTMCTHAYAISKRGAQKMVRFLRSEHFAYSRPVDHTFIHLNFHNLTINFSVLPAVVLQTKDSLSDITAGSGGLKSEFLVDSALERVLLLEKQKLGGVEMRVEGNKDHLMA